MAKRKKLNGQPYARPYRVRDPETKKGLPGLNYSDPDRALDGAWKAIHWYPVDGVLEVVNVNAGERLLCQYKSLVNGARILKGK